MKKILTAAAVVATMGFAGVASAQTSQLNGLYFEAKLNFAQTSKIVGSEKFRDTAAGLGLGYRLNESLAIEAGYDSLGKDSFGGNSFKLRTANIGLVASYQLTPDLIGNVKIGAINVEGKINGSKDDETKLYVGAGIEYPLMPQLTLTGDYRYTKAFDIKIHTVSVGTKYSF